MDKWRGNSKIRNKIGWCINTLNSFEHIPYLQSILVIYHVKIKIILIYTLKCCFEPILNDLHAIRPANCPVDIGNNVPWNIVIYVGIYLKHMGTYVYKINYMKIVIESLFIICKNLKR